MERASEKVIHSIKLLKSDVRFQNILEWFRSSLKIADKSNRSLKGDDLSRSQGEATALAEILKHVDQVDQFIFKK